MKIDIIGDIHGCFQELKELTSLLGYSWDKGVPLHPENRVLGFVGDLTDRGPQSLRVIEVVWKLVMEYKKAYYTPGNHCNKLYRFFLGNKVQITHGLETTVAEYESLSKRERESIRKKFITLYEQAPLYLVLDNNKLVIAHAGIKQELIGMNNEKVKKFVLYGDITGEKHPDGSPVRRDWAKTYNGDYIIVYGHTPVKQPRIINNTYNIDTGVVFGGSLTALRYPEMQMVSVPSTMPYIEEKFKKFD
ncbi:bis(5'-nucleosyl)-tetraphosphatase PrpE [Neobacillus thermocopriae]|uniref:Bis(5'-nucleosyl)-tetraphosphatase PrpE [asymmetrical] n=1 Tax=Neobacillus thermocopriae TaxID=1215031 RepID=A0A6B3TPH9_9BACI|nr:bis(5'-nucleosyl)-tetraphosphatase PrpE [Neobacillus thermocopriae]MED3623135.1 bis(5'-nucleosyl)-tetraphosphatase PrpE [Neobacillus thermocopriae]MED3715030.1 bis(5'-nucleosyl)-tetraphosphatase PrpE [Neobacillus thermocopriae]NEX78885.1 bis(5'-nucleosyl)-tetraphosphatase PrpE [Neobacillus thermocopriae]